jgi:ribosomal-protein-serine acetyltransferase
MFTLMQDEDVCLRLFNHQDAKELFCLTDSSRHYLREWLPWVDHTTTVEDSKSFIVMTLQQFASNNGFQTGIWYQGELAGVIGFHGMDWVNKKASIGYWLGEQFQGKGLMTKACHVFVRHAFTQLQLNRLEIRCAVGNKKSRAIPERLGFRKEGVVREAEWICDHFVDHVIYGMLTREWGHTIN